MSGAVSATSTPNLSRAAVVGLGVAALIAGVLLSLLLPFIVTAVCGWWLYDDLARDPSKRPGWLGLLGIGVFVVVATLSTALVTIADASSDCGAALLDIDDVGDDFDRACFDARLWRPVVGVVLTLLVGAFGFVGVRRSTADQPASTVSWRTAGVMAAAVVSVVVVLVAS